jgi:hypothetical protein
MNGQEVISLKEYFDSKLTELDKRLQVRFDLTDKQLCSSNAALEARLEQLNEFRAQILEERQAYARKDEMELRLNSLEKYTVAGQGGIASNKWAIGIIVTLVLLILGFVFNIIRG